MQVDELKIFGDDNMVVDTARVSMGKESNNYTDEQNERLIKFLARENHWSPFSHPRIQFRLIMPIYVERQLIKTQAGVEYNSISGRYVDFSDTYTLIEQFREKPTHTKQGSGYSLNKEDNEKALAIQSKVIETCKQAYKELDELGVCKEQARTILPLCLNTQQRWTGSLYSFIRLCHQRLAPDAQIETKQLVEEMLKQVKETGKFYKSLKAFGL